MRLLLIFICFYLPTCGFTQTAERWRNLGINDGLSGAIIHDITQDSTGFIWIATQEGLNRYDGESFESFPHKDPYNLGTANIIDLVIDGNNIWLVVESQGLYRYTPSTDETQFISALAGINIYKIHNVHNELWLATQGNGWLIYSKNLQELDYRFSELGNIIDVIPYKKDSVLYSLVGGGIFKSSLNTRPDLTLKKAKALVRKIDLNNRIQYTCETFMRVGSNIWAACWDNALHRIEDNDIESFLLPKESTFSFREDEIEIIEKLDQDLIVGLKSGLLYQFITSEEKFEPLTKKNFKGHDLRAIFIDRDQQIWIGTEKGLNVLETKKSLFEIVRIPNFKGKSVTVNAMVNVENSVFIGTSNGLYSLLEDSIVKIDLSFSESEIYSLLYDSGSLYLGTKFTVYQVDLKTLKTTDVFSSELVIPGSHYFNPAQILYSRYNSIVIQESKFGRILYAEAFGHAIVFYHLEEDWHSFTLLDGSIKGSLFNKLFVDSKENLHLLGSKDGYHKSVELTFNETCEMDTAFALLNLKEKCKICFTGLDAEKSMNHQNENLIESNYFTSIVEDEAGYFWIGTASGLYHFGDSIVKMEQRFNAIDAIQVKDDAVFTLSNGGLQVSKNGDWTHFYLNDSGIPEEGFTKCLLQNEDNLIIGGNGFVAISSIQDLSKTQVKNVEIEMTNIQSLKDNQKLIKDQEFYLLHERDHGLKVEFSTLNFGLDAKKTSYSYFVEGLYDFWLDNGTDNEILLPGLAGGDYVLLINAKNESGAVISEDFVCSIRVEFYWYNQLWFKLLLAFLIACTIWIVSYLYRRQKKKIQNVRDNISRDLHDDVGSLMGSISIYSKAASISVEKGDNDKVKQILEKIGIYSRETIDKMSDIVWSVKMDDDYLIDMFSKMEMFSSTLFETQGIELDFQMDSAIDSDLLTLRKRRNLFLIFKESVHNILKHAEAKSVKISMEKLSKEIILMIEDDGNGFDTKLEKHDGNGLASIKRRAQEIDAKIELKSSKGVGTKMIIRFSS